VTRGDQIKSLVAGAAILGAVAFGASRLISEDGGNIRGEVRYYYDLSEKKLFKGPRDGFPPLPGIGGEPDDGVLAVVVAPQGKCADPSAQRIVYLETFAPELQNYHQTVAKAMADGTDQPPAPDRKWVTDRTLVRRFTEEKWHAMSTREAMDIVREPLAKGPGGEEVEICLP
jgi:hypothetical protein